MKQYIQPEAQYVISDVADILTLSLSDENKKTVYSERFGGVDEIFV